MPDWWWPGPIQSGKVPRSDRPELPQGEPARPRHSHTEAVLRGPSGVTYQVHLPLLGAHQLANAATAIAVVEELGREGISASREDVERGLASVRWPGRLEVVSERPLVVVDGAHNGDSARKLAAALQEEFLYRRLILVLGTSTDKDVEGIIAALGPIADLAIATRSRHPRAADPERLAAELRRHCPTCASPQTSPPPSPSPNPWRLPATSSAPPDPSSPSPTPESTSASPPTRTEAYRLRAWRIRSPASLSVSRELA